MTDEQRARFEAQLAALMCDYSISVLTVFAFYNKGTNHFGGATFRLAAPNVATKLTVISSTAYSGALSAVNGISGAAVFPMASSQITIVGPKKGSDGGGMPF
jgi:hypothetical protein